MSVADIMQARILPFDPDRRRVGAPNLDVLLADISRGVEELKNRNQELEEKNAELQAALDRANERIAQLMRTRASADAVAIPRYHESGANGHGGLHAWNGNHSAGAERGSVPHTEPSVNTVEFVASKIGTFAALNGFYDEVRGLAGVLDAEPRGFEKGVLRLLVTYRDHRPLAGKLAELATFPVRFVSIEPHRIEVALL